uniref:Uncharacterized protein n=1 Tax=Parascaris equorum TaxID=6256 RepID=A0A914RSV6_PAREQ
LTLDTNPYECGLGHLVDLSKKNFIGKAALTVDIGGLRIGARMLEGPPVPIPLSDHNE